MNTLDRIAQLLKEHIGLHAQSVGTSAIDSAAHQRMAVCRIERLEEYADHLQTSPGELKQLIEAVVVPETWFFRDSKPFVTLKENVHQRFGRITEQEPLHILSLPCSTGEEPYSIAITLFEAGLRAAQFKIDAIDVSQQALEYALRGSYGMHSFRGKQDPTIRERYFQREHDRYIIAKQIRDQVYFRQGNILSNTTGIPGHNYDIIFCRNLLIYFDEQTKQRAHKTLHRVLKDDGVLFLGHAECGVIPQTLFTSLGPASAFSFRKVLPEASKNAADRPAQKASIRRRDASARPPHQRINAPTQVRPAPTGITATAPAADATAAKIKPLQRARQLADKGDLQAARAICQEQISSDGPCGDSYFLLGLIEESLGETTAAEEHLRKAVYLDPQHYESLVHLALIVEQRGDAKNAALLRRRAERAKN